MVVGVGMELTVSLQLRNWSNRCRHSSLEKELFPSRLRSWPSVRHLRACCCIGAHLEGGADFLGVFAGRGAWEGVGVRAKEEGRRREEAEEMYGCMNGESRQKIDRFGRERKKERESLRDERGKREDRLTRRI